MKRILKTWGDSCTLILRNPGITVPFIILSFINAFALYLLYLSPQRPVSLLLAPPVRAFFGEKFLHYPLNFVILPKLFWYAQVSISVSFGVILTALAVAIVAKAYDGQRPLFFLNLIQVVKRYFALLCVWLIPFVLGIVVFKLFLKMAGFTGGMRSLYVTSMAFLLSVIVQIIFIYTVPLIVIKKRSLLSSLFENVRVLIKLFVPSLFLVVVPAAVYLPVLLLKSKTVYLMTRLFPEVSLLILAAGIFVTFFIDLLIITSTTILFMETTGKKKKEGEMKIVSHQGTKTRRE